MGGDSSKRKIWVDGELVPWKDATVHVLSHSHQRGSLIFDYMAIHQTSRGPALFRMPEHLERLLESARLVGLPLSLGVKELAEACLATARVNPGARSLKVCAYLPSMEIEVVPADPRVSVAVAAYDPAMDLEGGGAARGPLLRIYLEQVKRRTHSRFIPPQAKVAANYLSPLLAKWNARKRGYDDILLLDVDGNLTEAPTSNVFFIDGEGRLCTPSVEFVLDGVTRRSLIELAKREGIPVREERIAGEEIFTAREVFLSTTSRGVWPVQSIDDKPVGGEGGLCPGPLSRQLGERLKRIECGEDPDFLHWLTFIEEDP